MNKNPRNNIRTVFVLSLFVCTIAFAQSGNISGVVKDKITNQGVPAKHSVWQLGSKDSTLIGQTENSANGLYSLNINVIPTSVNEMNTQTQIKQYLRRTNMSEFEFLYLGNEPFNYIIVDELGKTFTKGTITNGPGIYSLKPNNLGAAGRRFINISGKNFSISTKFINYSSLHGKTEANVKRIAPVIPPINKSMNLEDVVLRMRTESEGYETKDTVFAVPRDNPNKNIDVFLDEKYVDVKILMNDLDILFRPHNGNPLKYELGDKIYEFKKDAQGVIDTTLRVREKDLDRQGKLFFEETGTGANYDAWMEVLIGRRKNARMGEKNIFQGDDASNIRLAYANATLKQLSENGELDVLRMPVQGSVGKTPDGGPYNYHFKNQIFKDSIAVNQGRTLNRNWLPLEKDGETIDTVFIYAHSHRADDGYALHPTYMTNIINWLHRIKNVYEFAPGGRTVLNIAIDNLWNPWSVQKYQYLKDKYGGKNIIELKFNKNLSLNPFSPSVDVSDDNRIIKGEFYSGLSDVEITFLEKTASILGDFRHSWNYRIPVLNSDQSREISEAYKMLAYYRQLKDPGTKYP